MGKYAFLEVAVLSIFKVSECVHIKVTQSNKMCKIIRFNFTKQLQLWYFVALTLTISEANNQLCN